jgi:hypothetical protein
VTFHQEAFVEFSSAGLTFGSNGTLTFDLDESRAVTLVLESRWSGSVFSTEPEPLAFDLQEVSRRTILTDRVPNPFSLHVDARILPPGHDTFLFSVGPGNLEATVVAESRGDLYATVFYNEAAPPGWSILAGAA